MSVADGESRIMACRRGVYSHQSCFNIYTNDQPIHDGTRNFIYADDLCATSQYSAFHLRNTEANRSLKVEWNRTELENTSHPTYLGVTIDRTLSYKEHIHNTKMKVTTRNNLLRKLTNLKWGANASTIRTTSLTLCYYVAEYAAPVWARSSHAQKLNPERNSACRAVTGCLKPTNVEDLYLLAGIAPFDIRRYVCTRVEKTKQETNEAHSLYGQNPAEIRPKSGNCLLRRVKPADFPPKVIRCSA